MISSDDIFDRGDVDFLNKPSPFLRWAGGKRKLVPVLKGLFPKKFNGSTNRFHEPFVGGGSLMLALGEYPSSYYVPGRNLFINDSNPDLIHTYIAIRDNLDELLRELNKCSHDTSKAEFERLKAYNPKSSVKRAARFIYLNKTCFNGLWRVNALGQFNVPWGKLKNPNIFNEDNLRAVSIRLQESTITSTSFSNATNSVVKNDLVYFDPPYIPLSASSSFSSYAKEGFGITDHYALEGCIRGLSSRGAFVLLSNSDTPETRKIFGKSMHLYNLDVNRSVSANSKSRTTVKEIIASNFEIHTSNLPIKLTRVN